MMRNLTNYVFGRVEIASGKCKIKSCEEVDNDSTLPVEDVDLEAVQMERKTHARLQSISGLVDPIELYTSKFCAGRVAGDVQKDVQSYTFHRMKSKNADVFRLVSRKHFEIEIIDGECFVTDLSANGTFVNGNPIPKNVKTNIKNSDVISVGTADAYLWLYDERQKSSFPDMITNKYIVSNMELGKGGYSKVILAKVRNRAWRSVAIKVLNKRANTQFSRLLCNQEDIRKEIDIMCRIRHPNCNGYIDYLEDDDRAFIVLEYLGGGDLFTRITDRKDDKGDAIGLGEQISKFFCYQILKALEYLHDKGITHRDIKPENVLLADKRDYTLIKICDFGLAKPRDDASTMKSYVGTPAYIAPEIRANEMIYTTAVDMWSTGVVLFLMICGYPPFCESYGDMDLEQQTKTGRLIFAPDWKRVTAEAQNIVRRMIRVEARLRLTAKEALARPWFDSSTVLAAHKVIAKYKNDNDWKD